MNTQIAFLVAMVAAPVLITSRPAHAQAVSPTYREISVVGTPSEMPLVRAVSDRLRARFTRDAAFAKQVHDALGQNRQRDAIKLIAQVVQVPDAEIVIGQAKATSSAHSDAARMIHVAAIPGAVTWAAATFNPWWLIIETKSYVICVGLDGGCTKEMRRRGLIP